MRIALLLPVVLLVAACDTTGPTRAEVSTDFDPYRLTPIPLDSLSQEADPLIGTWEWVASVNYFTPSGPALSTPESAGRSQSWTFRADGQALYYENDELVREVTYEVSPRTYGNGTSETRPSLRFDGGYGEDFGTAGDLLVLDSTPVDGPQSRYRRQ